MHLTLANHWARLVELLCGCKRMLELSIDPDDPRHHAEGGVGVVEAPRSTLIHHYQTDDNGLMRKANLIVVTQNNVARIAMSMDKAARALIHNGRFDEQILNQVEMAFRA